MQNAGLIREVRGVMTRFEPLTEEIVVACTQDGLTYAELSDALSTYGLSIEKVVHDPTRKIFNTCYADYDLGLYADIILQREFIRGPGQAQFQKLARQGGICRTLAEQDWRGFYLKDVPLSMLIYDFQRRYKTAMRTKSWTGKGQECTHTRNGCEQSKHTSHPDIKRTRRSRSWDTHLTRRCVAGIGNIRKVEICTGISSGRLCIHRSKRRRRWPTIMPMGATIRKPLRPWDMSTGIVCGNGCWKRGRRRDRLVCRGEMS